LNHSGALITFEGLDGCGKTTQLELQADRLRGQSRRVMSTKEPGGTAVGRQLREILLNSANGPLAAATELALMFAARAQHIEEVIRPALQAGALVLCDRFTDSTIAYQGYGRQVPLEDISVLNRILCRSFRPDLTLLLSIDPETAAARTGSRNRTAHQKDSRFEDEGLEFFRRVRQGYADIAEREPSRVRVVDGRGTVPEVHDRISQLVDEFLKRR
jgi:dTMP kinase